MVYTRENPFLKRALSSMNLSTERLTDGYALFTSSLNLFEDPKEALQMNWGLHVGLAQLN
jgi:hypothetical protein